MVIAVLLSIVACSGNNQRATQQSDQVVKDGDTSGGASDGITSGNTANTVSETAPKAPSPTSTSTARANSINGCRGVGMVTESVRKTWLAQPANDKNMDVAIAQAIRSTMLGYDYPAAVNMQSMQAMLDLQNQLSYLITAPTDIQSTTVYTAAFTQCVILAEGLGGKPVKQIRVSQTTNNPTYLNQLRTCQQTSQSASSTCYVDAVAPFVIYQ